MAERSENTMCHSPCCADPILVLVLSFKKTFALVDLSPLLWFNSLSGAFFVFPQFRRLNPCCFNKAACQQLAFSRRASCAASSFPHSPWLQPVLLLPARFKTPRNARNNKVEATTAVTNVSTPAAFNRLLGLKPLTSWLLSF